MLPSEPATCSFSWTDENEKKLRTLTAQHYSASAAAKELGATRSSVISKRIRMGINPAPRRGEAPAVQAKTERENAKPTRYDPRDNKPLPQAIVAANVAKLMRAFVADPAPDAPPKSLMELGRYECRWPLDDANSQLVGFCGRAVMGSEHVYCVEHCLVAYRPGKVGAHARLA